MKIKEGCIINWGGYVFISQVTFTDITISACYRDTVYYFIEPKKSVELYYNLITDIFEEE